MKFGQFEIIPFVERKFKLDGGSMFGVIPKKIWGKMLPADENNLIPMETNLFVVRTPDKNILLDTGLGNCLSELEKKIYAIDTDTNIELGLQAMGLSTDDIDIVFLSHLHTDHAGGAVMFENEKIVPRFKNAGYMVQKTEWNDAINPNERTAAVYIPERLKVLEDSGQLELIDGEQEIFPGIRAIPTGGHTPGHQAIEISSEGATVVYYADIVPSSHHVRVPYVAAVDLNPLETMVVKRELTARLLDGDYTIVFDHDVDIKMLHQGETQAGDAMVQDNGLYMKGAFLQQGACKGRLP